MMCHMPSTAAIITLKFTNLFIHQQEIHNQQNQRTPKTNCIKNASNFTWSCTKKQLTKKNEYKKKKLHLIDISGNEISNEIIGFNRTWFPTSVTKELNLSSPINPVGDNKLQPFFSAQTNPSARYHNGHFKLTSQSI